jgi:hypothetical protein
VKFPQHILDLNPGLEKVQKQVSSSGRGYKSQLEERAANEWMPLMFKWWMYEPFKLNFLGSFYTPDFFGELVDGVLAAIEVKGYNQNLRADKLKYKSSCEVHGKWLRFCWLTWDKVGGWTEKWYDRQP